MSTKLTKILFVTKREYPSGYYNTAEAPSLQLRILLRVLM